MKELSHAKLRKLFKSLSINSRVGALCESVALDNQDAPFLLGETVSRDDADKFKVASIAIVSFAHFLKELILEKAFAEQLIRSDIESKLHSADLGDFQSTFSNLDSKEQISSEILELLGPHIEALEHATLQITITVAASENVCRLLFGISLDELLRCALGPLDDYVSKTIDLVRLNGNYEMAKRAKETDDLVDKLSHFWERISNQLQF